MHGGVHTAHLSSQRGIYPQTAGIRHFNGSQRGFHGYSMYRNEKGGPRLGPGSLQGQIYISTRAVKTPPPLPPIQLQHNGLCISTPPTSPHTLPKKTSSTTTLCCFLTRPSLPVTHRRFSEALSSCVHSCSRSLLVPKPSCCGCLFSLLLLVLLPFFSLNRRNLAFLHPGCL